MKDEDVTIMMHSNGIKKVYTQVIKCLDYTSDKEEHRGKAQVVRTS